MSDLISREAVIELVKNSYYNLADEQEDVWAMVEDVEQIPSADRPTVDKEYLIDLVQEAVYDGEACAKLMDIVDRPTGEWLVGDAWPHNVYCSVCYKTFAQAHWTVWEDGTLPRNYCPNCGARMTGGEE